MEKYCKNFHQHKGWNGPKSSRIDQILSEYYIIGKKEMTSHQKILNQKDWIKAIKQVKNSDKEEAI